jgi:putative hydrolase of the HAD superfamily
MDQLDLAYELPTGTLAAAAFAPARLLPAITGDLTDEQWRAAVADDLIEAAGSAQRAHGLVAEWSALTGEVDDVVAGLLAEARRHMPVVLVSNATTRLEADLDGLGITDLVDGIVSSARVGFAKPDPRIYHAAASRAGVPVDRCLFIDDSVKNTNAASAVGMTVVHYQRPQQLRDALAPVLDMAKPPSLSDRDRALGSTTEAS